MFQRKEGEKLKKFVAFTLFVAVLFSLSPLAFAAYTLAKPSAGQVIFMEADNSLDYRADFPISALTGAFREDDDLRLEFPAARLTLRGFFAPMGEWRAIAFSDGSSIGGADFDDNGSFTGSFHSVLEQGKIGQPAKLEAKAADVMPSMVTVIINPYGTKVLFGGEDIWNELRESALQAIKSLSQVEKPDWSIVEEQRYELYVNGDGSLSPLRAYTDFTDGIRTEIVKPECLYLSGSFSMQPLSQGRASVSFKNRLGNELLKAEVRCIEDESGVLRLMTSCGSCKVELNATLHYMPCGHYSCSEGFDPTVHGIAQCGTAGHCISENEHEKCTNCLSFTCDGQSHGIGACEHVHNWVATSLISSRCTGCGYVYTRK